MNWTDDMISITGHNAMCFFDEGYEIMFGGYESYKEFGGSIVLEEDVEAAINHEVLHAVLDMIEGPRPIRASECLDNIWWMYESSQSLDLSKLKGLSNYGLGDK